jgi:hypothetical protein
MTSSAPTFAPDFAYIATDIPEGVTIDEFRRNRPQPRSRFSLKVLAQVATSASTAAFHSRFSARQSSSVRLSFQ